MIGPHLLGVTLPDDITFVGAAIMCLVGAFGVVLSRNPVHSALFLILTLFGVAVLFVEQDAEFLAAVQVIVYAGAIVVLFLFVIMLIGVDRPERVAADSLKGQRPIAILLGLMVLAEVLLLSRTAWPTGAKSVAGSASANASNVAKLGRSVFTTYLLPFEVTSALLVIAVVGAVALARRPRAARPRPELDIEPVGDDGAAGGEAGGEAGAGTVGEVADEPAHDEPAHDEPAHDERAHDEPADDEPADDEPADDEPAHDEPAHDEEVLR